MEAPGPPGHQEQVPLQLHVGHGRRQCSPGSVGIKAQPEGTGTEASTEDELEGAEKRRPVRPGREEGQC